MLVFLLKASVCQLLFYAVYKLLLAKTTFHKANRCVILLAMAASVILAAADIRFESEHIPVGYANIAIDLISVNAVAMTEETPLSWLTVPNALALIYIIGVAVAMVRFAFPIAKLIRFVSRADKHRTADGYTLIVLDDDNMQSFSWFSYIVIPRKDYEEHGSEIICHEYAHVRLHHTETLMLMNLLCVVFWFNPIVWAMRNEMLLVDEFEADETVLQSGFEAKSYQHLLIRKSVEPSVYSLANGLSQKQLKKRIVMMKTKKSTMFAALRYGTLGAVVAAIIPAFASNTLVAPVEKVLHETITENVKAVMPFADTAEKQAAEVITPEALPKTQEIVAPDEVPTDTTAVAPNGELVYDVVDKLPEFNADGQNLMQYIATHLRYPKEAAKQDIQGRVIVQFVVRRDGRVTDAKILRSVEASLDAEALRVVESMPAWTPGEKDGRKVSVKFTLPIMFRLTDDDKAKPVANNNSKDNNSNEIYLNSSGRHISKDQIYCIVDGKNCSYEELEKINPDKIGSITIVKDPEKLKAMGVPEGKALVSVELKK